MTSRSGGSPAPFVCLRCKAGECYNCVDIMRVIADIPLICKCDAYNHDGEPSRQQILDPETGDIHAPGLIIKEDGSIERRD